MSTSKTDNKASAYKHDEASTIEEEQHKIKNKNKKRQGKGSKAKNDEKFRERKGEQVVRAFRNSILEKFGMLSNDSDRRLDEVVNAVQITPAVHAVPLSVSTRGVGFSTAIAYERTCTTWNAAAIAEIATIYQVYRVHLWLAHYKVYLAQQIQTESRCTLNVFERLSMEEGIRSKLQAVTRVPSVFSMVLDSIGRFVSNGQVYHMGYPHPDLRDCSIASLLVNPLTIRGLLEALTVDERPAERQDFISHNPIPGLSIVDGLATNINDVWPLNAPELLDSDIHAYKNWVTRVENRLPKHSFSDIVLSGDGHDSGLWSTEILDLKLVSHFRRAEVATVRRRNAAGAMQLVTTAAGQVYTGFTMNEARAEFWSRNPTPHVSVVIGTASLVGEVCGISTRHEINGGGTVTISPTDMMYGIADAKR